jgi:hypothetical protein
MRKLGVVAFLATLAASGLAAAIADAPVAPKVTVKASVSPNRAGTKSHPQGVTLKTKISWQTLGSATQPIVQTFDILFPKGSLYNGAHLPSCSYSKLNAVGPAGCPKGSIVGSGSGNAYADTTITHPKITVVNGGASRVFFYTVLNNPARVQSPVVGIIKKTSGKYAYSLHVTVPQVLQVVAGVPIELTLLNVTAGKGTWLETTSCGPGGHWPFSVSTGYNTGGSAKFTASIACHK